MYAYYNITGGINDLNEFFEIALTIGNLSSWYKFCYVNANSGVMDVYYYFLSFGSIQNYLIDLIPNLLSYAFVMPYWITKLEDMQSAGNTTGLVYIYCVIIKDLLIFDPPLETSLLKSSYDIDEMHDFSTRYLTKEFIDDFS